MSEQDRVHEASPIRLLRAKEEGMVARSAELSRSLVFCILLGSILLSAGSFLSLFSKQISHSIRNVDIAWSGVSITNENTIGFLLPLFVFLGVIFLFAIATWHFQAPLGANFEKMAPDFGRISILGALRRVFSLHHWIKVALWLFGFVAIGVLAFSLTWNQSTKIAAIANMDLKNGLSTTSNFLRNALVSAGAIILVLGVADYVRERIRLASQLRMTDQERREEARNTEMNPELRRRLFQ